MAHNSSLSWLTEWLPQDRASFSTATATVEPENIQGALTPVEMPYAMDSEQCTYRSRRMSPTIHLS